jgi:hypothetical protein
MSEEKPHIQQIADYYNAQTPKKQRQLDAQLKLAQARLMATPHALFRLFPGLGNKSLKPKDRNAL